MNPVEVNIRINQSREKIWKAISEPELMKNWFFDNIPDFKAEVGFKTWFIVKNEDRIFYHVLKYAKAVDVCDQRPLVGI